MKKMIAGKIFSVLLNKKNDNFTRNNSGFVFLIISKEVPFLILAILTIIAYAIFGIYEILFNSPLSNWVASFWNSLMNISPQTIMDIPKQNTPENSLMQKTVADRIGLLAPVIGDIFSVILAPMASLFGTLFVFAAMAVRFGKHILGFFSPASLRKNYANAVSWGLLLLSIVPLAIKYF